MHCCAMLAALTATSLSPATTFACLTTLSTPSVTNVNGDPSYCHSCRPVWVTTKVGTPKGGLIPPVGGVERPPARHKRPYLAVRLLKEIGALRRDSEHHLGTRQPVFGVATGVPREESLTAVTQGCFRAVVRPSDKAVQ